MTHHTRAAIYCRVSTKDQNCARQRADLTAWAARMGVEVVEVFMETASGAKVDRALRARACEGVRKGRYSAILVTEPSRWSRSLVDLVTTLEALARDGGSLLSLNGFSFDVTTPSGRLMAGILGSLAEFERDLIRERVKSGMEAAARRGVHCGRKAGPAASYKHDDAVIALRLTGMSMRAIATSLQVSLGTVRNAITRRRNASPKGTLASIRESVSI